VKKYLSKKITKDEAIKEIGNNFYTIYKAFINAKTHE
jgi:hypothetical protein